MNIANLCNDTNIETFNSWEVQSKLEPQKQQQEGFEEKKEIFVAGPKIDDEDHLLYKRRIKTNQKFWTHIKVELVKSLPLGIDGNRVFRIHLPENKENSIAKKKIINTLLFDGRYWETPYNCNIPSFKGKRRQTKCLGGAVCPNENCPYFLRQKSQNREFFKDGKLSFGLQRICSECSTVAKTYKCPTVRKIFEWLSDSDLVVKYIGTHHSLCQSVTTKPLWGKIHLCAQD